jgi:DNA (cytosine-5)-methyltransferase 1
MSSTRPRPGGDHAEPASERPVLFRCTGAPAGNHHADFTVTSAAPNLCQAAVLEDQVRLARGVLPVSRPPRLLDLFCGAGGAGAGYAAAGFEVVGVDNRPMPRYPFEFVLADALDVLADRRFLARFDVVHASPPCQRWALASRYNGRDYPDLIGPTRALLAGLAVPWVIENVPGAPLRPDFRLCGCMFGLDLPGVGQLRRERWFETSWGASGSEIPHRHRGPAISIAGHGTPQWMRARTGHIGVAAWRQVMRIDWMRREELTEAIPPPYTEHVGARLLEHMATAGAAR